MAREFKAGTDVNVSQGDGRVGMFGITEVGAVPMSPKPGDWVNRIQVFGDSKLRDRIVALLMAHGMGE